MSVRGTRIPAHLQLPIAGVTPPPTEKDGQRLFPTGNFRFFRPVYKDKTPPCNNACPTGEQIQKYLDYVKHERYLDGYLTILEDNSMPSVTGRVCYHPCETACNRAEHDEPIGIRSVERFLGDYGLALPENPIAGSLPALNGTTVAIVGSGPAGLACAYHLRRLGYSSVIFEALDKPGGMLPSTRRSPSCSRSAASRSAAASGPARTSAGTNCATTPPPSWRSARTWASGCRSTGSSPAASPAPWSSSARPVLAAR